MSETTTSNITEEVNDNADENITEGASENIDEFSEEEDIEDVNENVSGEQTQWETLRNHEDYEICTTYPFTIRRKKDKHIMSECLNNYGYIVLSLNNKIHLKHRIIAEQWIENPNNLKEIDHINHDRTDNRISNLRWCSKSENNRNKSKYGDIVYEFVDEISDEAVEITDYGKHSFEFYYYVENEDAFYYYTGPNYRKLHINFTKTGAAYVSMIDTENKSVILCINKFKRLYGFM
ncbi:His-Me finger endonucleases family [Trichomonas vaginalis G3]|uniref:His-Me finger endonucleases family n=1 Tax=Trichomonas vaginalis (strain ATCC PRA-98 / G3) TaxID=412133 RepID=UPI0021E5ACC0|nr:His-Me finger endonucleases family [Trichomonas vaginalis G3]KAI5532638.1 His-Me finger endonucleases family [Trichomonas vaginalis G3]